MDKILKGVIRYSKTVKPDLLKEFKRIRENPKPTALMFTCMDSRLCPMKITSADVGDLFVVRNAGNFVPRAPAAAHLIYDSITCEPGALELACVRSSITDVIICGHSDCKAIHLLHDKKDELDDHSGDSPLEMWVKKHGAPAVLKYKELRSAGDRATGPLKFYGETLEHMLEAHIDVENKFAEVDKLSQINCLQQLQNITTYNFLQSRLKNNEVRLHAMWFDIHEGDVYLFNHKKKCFTKINEDSVKQLKN